MKENKETIARYAYVEELPQINLSGNFLILKSAHETITEDWLSFINFYIKNEIPDSSPNKKNPQVNFKKTYIDGSNNFIGINDNLAELFGFKGNFHIISFKSFDNVYKFESVASYDFLIEKLFATNSVTFGHLINRTTMIDRFFLFQLSKGKLLYPLKPGKEIVSRNYKYRNFFGDDNKLLISFTEYLETRHANKKSRDWSGNLNSYTFL